ncbi:MAG: flagellar hook-basal body complex protein FliE [bacterium]
MEAIRFANLIHTAQAGSQPAQAKGNQEGSFEKMLQRSMEEVNALQEQAEQAIQDLATGQTEDLHKTMILMEKAELSLKLMVQVRNKLLDAYQEIMRMPV